MRTGWMTLALVAGLADPALSHPHIYIDTGVEVLFDSEGRATAVEVTWVYDEFYSLSVLAELGLDPDGDGALTEPELAAISGFDMNWIEGFAGDTYVLADDLPVALGPPRDWSAGYSDGRLLSTHLRDLNPVVDPRKARLVVQAYDPGFYSAYTIVGPAVLTGIAGCSAAIYGPDLDAADEQLRAALAEYGADEDVELDFPAVGAAFADEVRVSCAAPS